MTSITERLALLPQDRRDAFEDRLRQAAGTVAAEPVAVIGLGCRLPGGVTGPESYWRLLVEGRDAIGEVPSDRWDADAYYSPDPHTPGRTNSRWGGFLPDVAGFDAEFFGISPREAEAMDPQQRLLLEVAWEAVENAGLPPGSLRGTRTGLFAGVYYNEYQRAGSGDLAALDAYSSTGNAHSVTVGRVSYLLDLRGPSAAVDTACSSSLVALHLAAQSLRLRESDLALAGGVNLILTPETQIALSRWGMLSPHGRCRSFDAGADGFVRGEGCGVVLLKRLPDALRDGDRVLAVVRGSAVNSDGRSQGLTAPSGTAQRAVLSEAVARAGVPPRSVGLVETHGTGTALGDPIEFEALASVYGAGEGRCALGAVKTNLGHLEAAAGMAGFIKAVLAVRSGIVPPNLHFTDWNPALDPAGTRFFVPTEGSPWPVPDAPRRAAVSSFGFGGTNAHVVIEEAGPLSAPPEDTSVTTLTLSGTAPERVGVAASALAAWLDADGASTPLGDVAHTLARRSDATAPARAAVVARSRDELLDGLRALEAGEPGPGVVTSEGPAATGGVVWVFPGHGSQWAGMGRRLLADEPAFAAAVDELDPLLAAEAGFSLREVLASGEEVTGIGRVQPVLFGMQVALAALWRSHGAEPDAVIGHSMGEVAAAVVAGALSPEDGVKVIARRSRLLASIAGQGSMAALGLGPDEAAELTAALPGVDVAAFSSPHQTVVAGDPGQVAALVDDVAARGLLARPVRVEVASHSPQVDPLLDELAALLADVRGAEPSVAFHSTVLDGPGERPRFDAAYWTANLRRPVRFTQAVTSAVRTGAAAFVEISPHPLLTHAVTETVGEDGPAVLGTLRRDGDDTRSFHTALAELRIRRGTRPPAVEGRLIDLPGTPWRHTRHWIADGGRPVVARGGAHPLLGPHAEVPGKRTHLWQSDLGLAAHPWLGDHRVHGTPVLPAAAYAELFLAAATEVFGGPGRELALSGLALEEILPLGDSTPVTVVLVQTGAQSARVHLHSRTPAGGWVTHARAEVTHGQVTLTAVPDLPAPDGGEAVKPADLYARLRAAGQWHGPAFAGITEVHAAPDGAATTTVALPGTAVPDARYHVHPALLDSCLQTLAAAAPRGPADDPASVTYLPMELGRVRLLGDPARGGVCHAWLEPVDEEGADLQGEVRLVDADGAVVLEIDGIYVRRVERRTVPDPLPDKLFETIWVPRALPVAPGRTGTWLVLGEPGPHRDGVVERLAAEGHQTRGGTPDDPVAEADGAVLLVPDEATLEASEALVATVARIVRGLVTTGRAPRLWLVGREGTGGAAPEPGAALRGLVRVLAFEHPDLRVTLLDPGTDAATAIAAELAAPGTADTEISWRSGTRHVARLDRATLPEGAGTPFVRPGAAYVITGGLGGLGLVVARRLADQGAGRLVLNGRSGPSAEAERELDGLRAAGADVVVVTGDIAAPGVAERLVDAARSGGRDLRGVVHAAAVIDDRVVAGLDPEGVARVWRPKVQGAWRLHEATSGTDLDWWAAFSSAASLLGSPGQGAYAAANAWLDAFVHRRRALGLPATGINWGAWAEVGRAREGGGVLELMTPAEGLEALEAVLASGRATTGVLRLDAGRALTAMPEVRAAPYFERLVETPLPDDDWEGAAALREGDPESARRLVTARLRAQVSAVLGQRPERLDAGLPLTRAGLDSLMAVRIKNAVQHDLDVALSLPALLTGATLADLATAVLDELGVQAPAETARPASRLVWPRDAAERLVAGVWETALATGPIGVTEDFFAAGGTPELAATVTRLLSERSGEALDADRLFARPTIEDMARLVRDTAPSGTPLRPLRARGDRTPLLLFHPAGGDTAVYRRLVELLGADQPCFGLDRVPELADVRPKAVHYARLIRERWPSGPYRLGGWSFGGFLAYETARVLAADGADVDLVALIDSVRPLALPGVPPEKLMLDRFTGYAAYLERTYGLAVPLPLDELARADEGTQFDLVMKAVADAGLISADVAPDILRHQRESFEDLRAIERHDPPGPYRGRVVLYRATEPPVNGLTDPRYTRTDATLGWDEVCDSFETVAVPGHHLSVLDPPNVDVLARHLADLLAREPERAAGR
ncbi:SDR family NAD(P)-dependent oxidoreductase [Spirillospora sp. CA-294931]|uniref:SDR family NAD(P)-dependent oxidoreductase n=1 Tax=Spirillospora sp. CA-294931 TaxID=3240042 RepID=UPI003D8AE933